MPDPVVLPGVVPVEKPQTTDQRSDAAIPYVRALLTIVLVVSLVGFYWVEKWAPDALTVMAATAFGYYFGSRTSSNEK